MSEQNKQQEPGAGAHDRILDLAEAGLWIVLLVIGTLVALEVPRSEVPRSRPIAERGPAPTGLIEAENLPVIAKSGDFNFWLQPSTAFPGGRWSKDGHMFAQNVKKGDWIDLRLPEREPGNHRLALFLTRSVGSETSWKASASAISSRDHIRAATRSVREIRHSSREPDAVVKRRSATATHREIRVGLDHKCAR